MSQRLATNRGRKTGGRNRMMLLWIAALGLIVFLLIYFEQTAILYVLATLGLTTLLIIVAFADLRGKSVAGDLPKPNDDAAAIGTGIGSTIRTPQAPAAPRTARPAKRK